ncbi:MAG: phosphopantothenoylcysteine decarboxylase, partial [candidate division WOR-3 bacterium]|nr:phosphopantothenoylcysteine decarboxylase [candidate division WOR-3 bacterium]
MKRLRVLVTAGPTYEYIDPIRIITNPSSGKMGIAIARELYKRGAQVTLVYGPGTEIAPSYLKIINVKTTVQMHNVVINELKSKHYDIVIATAACADFTPRKPSAQKITTEKVGEITLTLKPTPKIINHVKQLSPKTFLVAFKAEYNRKKKELIEIALKRLKSSKADLIVVNDVAKPGAGFEADKNEVFVIDPKRNITHIPMAQKSII